MKTKRSIEMTINCGVQGCCPTVKVKGDKVTLKDDFGNTARMSKSQWLALAQQTIARI